MPDIIKEFKEFAVKGNMIDIAIGVIIGAAFNKVVDVLVKDILLPPLSFLTGGLSWENKKIVLREAVAAQAEIAIQYGKLIAAFLDFLIIGIVVFLVVKFMNRLRNKAHDTRDHTVKTPKDIALLSKIAELLETQNKLLDKPNG